MTEQHLTKIDEEKVWADDVKRMSYEDLMAAVRFLDHERQVLTKMIEDPAREQNNHNKKQKNKAA